MTILRLTSAALLAAGLGFAGTAQAAPAANLSGDQPSAQRSDEGAVTPVWHYGYRHYGYYGYYGYYPRYYYPRYYYPRYYYPYYGYPYYYGYGPSFNFGIRVR